MESLNNQGFGGSFYEQVEDEENDGPVDESYEKEKSNKIQERTLQKHFQRMSCKRKMDLITKMFYETRALSSLSSILNIFFSVNTKLIFYSKITNDSNSLYEQFVQDHDRMLDSVVLDESLSEDMKWFRTLEDTEQEDVIISMLRLSGGNVIKKMYWRLIKIFNERSLDLKVDNKKYISRTSMDFPEKAEKKDLTLREYQPKFRGENENDYNPECPTHKKVIEGRKQWQIAMGKLKKDIEAELLKLNEPIVQKKATKDRNSSKKSSKKKNKKKKKKSGRSRNSSPRPKFEETDWIQLLPVWTVKKIFSYLDKKVLQGLKNVNNYWSIISKQVLAEQKMRMQLDSIIKKSKENLDHLLGASESDLVIEDSAVVLENTAHKRRMEKQRRTATSLKVIDVDPNSLHTKTLLPECFQLLETEFQSLLVHLRPFPVGVPMVPDYDVDKFGDTATEPVEDHIELDRDDSAGHSKILTFDEDKQNMSDSIDILTVGSMVPSIFVSNENLGSW